MSFLTNRRWLGGWLFVVGVLLTAPNHAREWRIGGDRFRGEFERLENGEVHLRVDGNVKVVSVQELSPKDRAYVTSITLERTWTNQSGKQITASLVGRSATSITIRKDNKEFTIPISGLSASDQQRLQRIIPWTGDPATDQPFAETTQPKPVPATSPTPPVAPRTDSPALTKSIQESEAITQPPTSNVIESEPTPSLTVTASSDATSPLPLTTTEPAQPPAGAPLLAIDASREAHLDPRPIFAPTRDAPTRDASTEASDEKWTMNDGASMTGRFQKMEGELVWFQRSFGVQVLPLNRFSENDQKKIRDLAAAMAPPPPTAAPAPNVTTPESPSPTPETPSVAIAANPIDMGTPEPPNIPPPYVPDGSMDQVEVHEVPVAYDEYDEYYEDESPRIRLRGRSIVRLVMLAGFIVISAVGAIFRKLNG